MKLAKKILIVILSVFTMFLCSCTTQDYTITVNDDDSVDMTIRYAVDRDTYDLLSSYGIDTSYMLEQNEDSQNPIERCDVLFQEIASVFYDYGFEITAINESVQVGFDAQKSYSTIEDFNIDMTSLYEEGIISLSGTITKTESIFNKTYLFSGELEYLIDPDTADISDDEIAELESLYADLDNLKAQVTLKMPGSLVAHDGEIENNAAVYSALYKDSDVTPVHLQTQITNTLIRYVIFGIIIVAIIIAIIWYLRRRKAKREEKKMEELYGSDEDDYYDDYDDGDDW